MQLGWPLAMRAAFKDTVYMKLLLRTNNLVLISYIEAILSNLGIGYFVADQGISSLEGSIGAFPRRILVDDDDYHAARRALMNAELGHELEQEAK
jgi:hypothetical protein